MTDLQRALIVMGTFGFLMTSVIAWSLTYDLGVIMGMTFCLIVRRVEKRPTSL